MSRTAYLWIGDELSIQDASQIFSSQVFPEISGGAAVENAHMSKYSNMSVGDP